MTESAAPQPEDPVVVAPPAQPAPAQPDAYVEAAPFGPPLSVSPDGEFGRAPARVASQMRRFDRSLLDLVQQQSTLKLFFLWMGTIVVSGLCFWLGARAGEHGLVEGGHPVGGDFNGFVDAIYFSFVTATSIGYGDIVPVGFARVVACAEAVTALLIFGAVVAKFVSHRSDQLVGEIHRVTFEERLDRIQTNLHVVISDMISITAVSEAPDPPLSRISTRLESSMLLFQSEMRIDPRSPLSAKADHRGRGTLRHSRRSEFDTDRIRRPAHHFARGLPALAAVRDHTSKPEPLCRRYLQRLRPPFLHAQAGLLDGPNQSHRRPHQIRRAGHESLRDFLNTGCRDHPAQGGAEPTVGSALD